jgi:hypothetical protein
VLVVCASVELPQAVTASARIRIGGSQRTGPRVAGSRLRAR